jgi:hypothetical protein
MAVRVYPGYSAGVHDRSRSSQARCLAAALLAALGVLGCSERLVIPPADRTFARASERLERTTDRVDASGAPPRERALFLQAEGLYRYRYADVRGNAAIVAEAAAAATDLPIVQSFAGSLDLVDVRLRSADAAVHLWESFLERYPTSPLRPLTLYRLGFAYRSVSVDGLPRSSGDDAFDELAKLEAPEDIAAAAREARTVRWKSKTTAARLSILPGLGQFYVDEPVAGSIRLAIALAAAAAVIGPAIVAASRPSELTWAHDWPLLATSAGGLVVLSFDYTSSYEAATRSVVHSNEAEEAKFEDSHPSAP